MSWLKKFVKLLRDIWLIFGITVFFLVLIAIAATAAQKIKNKYKSPGIDSRSRADSYAGEAWSTNLFRELEVSGGLKWTPYLYWRHREFHGNYINVDTGGNRVTSDSKSTQEQNTPVKIFMFGASTLWGVGVRDEFTIPSNLSRELERHGIHCKVTNLAETGFVSTQEVIEMLLQLQGDNIPDIVIFYGGTSDMNSAWEQGVAGLPMNELNRVREFNLTKPEKFWPAAVRESLNGQPKNLHWVDAQTTTTDCLLLAQQVIRVYTNNLKLVDAFSQAYGFKCLFYLEPTLFQKRYLSPYEAGASRAQTDQSGKMSNPILDLTHNLFREAGPGIAASFPFHDVSDCFSQTRDAIFIDYYHMGERGNAIIAQRILRDVEPLIRTNITLRQIAITK